MTENTTPKATPADVLAAAQDEFNFANAVAQAGFPGRLPQSVIGSARKLMGASKLLQGATEDELANASAKAAGATGLASHDRNRVAVQFQASKDVVKAAAAASGSRVNTARTLVWYLVAITTAEAELEAKPPVSLTKPARGAKTGS
jgi:hypothetical protein